MIHHGHDHVQIGNMLMHTCINPDALTHHPHVSETHWCFLLQYSHCALADRSPHCLFNSLAVAQQKYLPQAPERSTKFHFMLPVQHLHCRLTGTGEHSEEAGLTPESCFLGTGRSQPLKQRLEHKRQISVPSRPPCRWPFPPSPLPSPALKAEEQIASAH